MNYFFPIIKNKFILNYIIMKMDIYIIDEILKYLDCFGTTFNFYIERNRKFYTSLGGILTLLSIFFGIVVFIFINFDDFSYNIPISTISTTEYYKNITFGEEKIWIPWRIRNYRGKTINHTNLLFPIIYYYKISKNNNDMSSYEVINYKLCNETSMANKSDLYMIDKKLDELYCIDMEDLYIGGNWNSDFLNFVEFDLFICKNGIDYDQNNTNCTTYEKIVEIAGKYNCLDFEMYYPVVYYQPMNKTTPIFVKYTNYFYHLSRFSNKIDRIYLQQHILKDNRNFIYKNENTYSLWGRYSLDGDNYATGNIKDLMSEGSTSRLYSFNIYLKSEVVHYNRSYKNIFLIIADGLPLMNIIFIFFKLIAKVFKISSANKKLTELLFENLHKKRSIRFGSEGVKLTSKNVNLDKKLNMTKSSENNVLSNKNNDYSSFQLNQQELDKKIVFQRVDPKQKSIKSPRNKSRFFKTSNNKLSTCNKKESNKSFNNINNFNNENNDNINNINNFNGNNNNIEDFFSIKSNEISSNHPNNNLSNIIKLNFVDNGNVNYKKNWTKSDYIKKTLFPYKYYFCSVFIKNLDVSKNSKFFPKKFISVYYFICQLFDISSYLLLQREFEIMKNTIMVGKYKDILESRKKINVNDLSFNINIKECLDTQKFSILGKVK